MIRLHILDLSTPVMVEQTRVFRGPARGFSANDARRHMNRYHMVSRMSLATSWALHAPQDYSLGDVSYRTGKGPTCALLHQELWFFAREFRTWEEKGTYVHEMPIISVDAIEWSRAYGDYAEVYIKDSDGILIPDTEVLYRIITGETKSVQEAALGVC